ncbi:hypothetical protein [Streptomyces sp. NPDC003247]|uniref:hypothetical protein n=1 Tax=Streptomyces sp. NPDC003247 TaxID=3364677 RepID=UPI0036C724CB
MAFHRAIGVKDDMLDVLAQHHTTDDTRSYYVLYDRTATWDHPGRPQIVALHLRRDHQSRTLRFEQETLPLPSMAQSWLIHRGCPPEAIALDPELGTVPADSATRALERRLVDGGDHYALGWSYTRDDPDDHVTLAALRALDERAPSPFRVLVEEVDRQAWTHTLREAAFDTVHEAMTWCYDRLSGTTVPLPPIRPKLPSPLSAVVPQATASRPPGRSL